MKLTAEQIKLRTTFREKLLHLWLASASLGVVAWHVADALGVRVGYEELEKIPSIGKFYGHTPCPSWLARHYPKTSAKMFAGASIEAAMKVWGTEKRTTVASSAEYQSARAATRRAAKTIMEIGTLNATKGDRYEGTNWGRIK